MNRLSYRDKRVAEGDYQVNNRIARIIQRGCV